MNITQTEKSNLTATIQINLLKTDYEPEVQKALKEYQRKASMPGFRPGKVPFGMVKKMYGKGVLAEKVNQIVSDALNNYIIEQKLQVMGYPVADMEKNDIIDFDTQDDFNFYFEVAMAPEFDIDLTTLKVDYYNIKASDEDVEKTINNILEGNPNHSHPEKVGEKDKLDVRLFQADTNGQEVENGFTKELTFHLDQVTNEEAKKLLVDKETGAEFIFNFSKASGSDEAAAKMLGIEDMALAASDFNMIIDEIHREEPAVLDEELFEKIYPGQEVKDIKVFKEKIKADIEKQYVQESDRYFFGKAVDELLEKANFEMPNEFLKKWIVDNSEGKMTMEEVEKDYDAKYAKSFRWQLIEEKLLKQNEDLIVKEQEIREVVKSYFFGGFQGQGLDDEMSSRMEGIVDTMLKNQDERRRISNQVAEQKMTKYFKEQFKLKEKAISYEDFAKMVTENNEKD